MKSDALWVNAAAVCTAARCLGRPHGRGGGSLAIIFIVVPVQVEASIVLVDNNDQCSSIKPQVESNPSNIIPILILGWKSSNK